MGCRDKSHYNPAKKSGSLVCERTASLYVAEWGGISFFGLRSS